MRRLIWRAFQFLAIACGIGCLLGMAFGIGFAGALVTLACT